VKKRRRRSRKAKAGPKGYPNLLAIPKWQPRQPTPDPEAAERGRWPFPPSYFPPGWRWGAQTAPAEPAKPKGGRQRRRRPSDKFDLVLRILADIKPAPGLSPAEIQKKVLSKIPPEFRQRWEKVGPDGVLKPAVSRKVINLAYQKHLKVRSGK
jgi:hypothetical protein